MLDTFTSRSFQEAVILVVVVVSLLLLVGDDNNDDDDVDTGNNAEEEGPIILVASAVLSRRPLLFLLEINFDRDDADDVVNALVDGSRLSKIASFSALSLAIMPDANAASFEFDIVIVLSSMKASCSSSSIDMNSRYLR